MISTLTLLAVLVVFWLFAYRRLLRYLHLFQQDDYDGQRFLGWLWSNHSFDWRLSLGLLLVGGGWILGLPNLPIAIWLAIVGGLILVIALLEPNPLREAKKPLVLTKRARNIVWVALGFDVVAAGLVFFLWTGWTFGDAPPSSAWHWLVYFLVCIQFLPLALVGANTLLKPIEARTQRFFWHDARRRLGEINPMIIAVTGSFGKTSVKHLLGHVLELTARGYFTPGSVNTPMGIARVIREALPSDCSHFVVEMGAYGPGSIAKLCELTPPRLGIITAIGEAHYERFKSLDTVTRAKFELAEATLKSAEGKVVLHESVFEQPYARGFVAANRSRVIICGTGRGADVAIVSSDQGPNGLVVMLRWQGNNYHVTAPIYGLHQVGNLALVFGACIVLGIKPDRIVAALRSAPQVKHRLEVKSRSDGGIYIDDAYNSNPEGFRSALSLLSKLGRPNQRRVLVTPGMVELGERHDAIHRELGQRAGEIADIAIVIRPVRIPTFVEGLRMRKECTVLTFESLDQAQEWMLANGTSRDIVLVENDLPDLYERKFQP